jgi:hypothetical protein
MSVPPAVAGGYVIKLILLVPAWFIKRTFNTDQPATAGGPSALMHLPTLDCTKTFVPFEEAIAAPAVHSTRMHGEYFGPIVNGHPTTG